MWQVSVHQFSGSDGRIKPTRQGPHLSYVARAGVLSDPAVLEGADPRMAAIWRWHAIEETEHKAVAYDV